LIRSSLIDSTTHAFRVLHGASGWLAGIFIDRLGDYLLVQTERPLDNAESEMISEIARFLRVRWNSSKNSREKHSRKNCP